MWHLRRGTWLLSLVVLHLWCADAVAGRELLIDSHVARGVMVIPPSSTASIAPLSPAVRQTPVCLPVRDCSQKPVWQLQQWSNAADIVQAKNVGQEWTLTDSAGRLQKRLQITPGDIAGDVMLEMNALSEFAARSTDGIPHYLPDLRRPWPHWLLSQQLDSGRLAQYQRILLRGKIRLLKDEPQRAGNYNSSVNAARFLLAITIRNRLTGDFFWLTLPLYDDRFTHTPLGCQKCMQDGERCYTPQSLADEGRWRCPEDRVGEQWRHNEKPGTARMIFRMPTQAFVHGEVRQGGWVSIDGDILPYIRAAIDAVRDRERSKHFPQALMFYELGLFSLGWEMTGLNHAAIQLRDWQLTGDTGERAAVNP